MDPRWMYKSLSQLLFQSTRLYLLDGILMLRSSLKKPSPKIWLSSRTEAISGLKMSNSRVSSAMRSSPSITPKSLQEPLSKLSLSLPRDLVDTLPPIDSRLMVKSLARSFTSTLQLKPSLSLSSNKKLRSHKDHLYSTASFLLLLKNLPRLPKMTSL